MHREFSNHAHSLGAWHAVVQRAIREQMGKPAVAPEARLFFQSMFTDRGNGPVTQTVSNLWTPASGDAPPAAPSLMLNLFTDAPAAPRKRPGGKI